MMAPDLEEWKVSYYWKGAERRAIYLCEDKRCIGVLDNGCHTVGVDSQIRRLLEFGGGIDLGCVGDAEFFEKKCDFPWIRAG